jgi:hypothetical protein
MGIEKEEPVRQCQSHKTIVQITLFCLMVFLGAGVFAADLAETVDAASEPAPQAAEESPADAAAQPAEGAEAETDGKETKKWIGGRFEGGFDGVWADGETDIELNQRLKLDIDPPQCERLHLRGYLWMNEDLDSDEPMNSSLRTINDASNSDVRARLLYLYAEYDDLWGDSTLRVGRQRIAEGAAFNRIDGAYFKKRTERWDWYVFGGARATIYGDAHKNLVTGGGASYRLTERTRVALDTYYGEEHRDDSDVVYGNPLADLLGWSYPRHVEEDLDDWLVAASVWQTVTQNLLLFGRYGLNENGGDDIRLEATGFSPSWDLTYQLSYRRLTDSLGDRVPDLSTYYRILGVQNEYDDFMISLTRTLSAKFALSLESEIHEAGNNDVETGNRDYWRNAATLSGTNLVKGIDAALTLERWDVDGDSGTWTITGEVSKRWEPLLLTVGADYERFEDRIVVYNAPLNVLNQAALAFIPGFYRGFNPILFFFDRTTVELHENIHSVYGKLKWTICEDQDWTIRLSYEEDDEPESPYWRVQTEYGIRF